MAEKTRTVKDLDIDLETLKSQVESGADAGRIMAEDIRQIKQSVLELKQLQGNLSKDVVALSNGDLNVQPEKQEDKKASFGDLIWNDRGGFGKGVVVVGSLLVVGGVSYYAYKKVSAKKAEGRDNDLDRLVDMKSKLEI